MTNCVLDVTLVPRFCFVLLFVNVVCLPLPYVVGQVGKASTTQEKQSIARLRGRVVYTFSNVRAEGSNTQYMKLTPPDIESRKELNKKLQTE